MNRKISFIITDITGKGGIERTTSLICNKLVRENYEVTVYSIFHNEIKPYIQIDNRIDIKFLTNKRYELPISILRRVVLLLIGLINLIRYKKILRSSTIVCQAFLPAFLIYISGLSSYSIVCEHFNYNLYGKIVTKIRNYIYSKFRVVVTLTDNDKKKFEFAGIKAYTIPNIVPFSIQKNYGELSKRIISIGRLHYQKGYDILLESLVKVFNKYPDWRIDIFGIGKEQKKLESIAHRLQIHSYVNFRGFTNNISEELQKSSFYVMSSRYEGFPMVLLEAMACGCPIVSFNCPEGPSEILKNDIGIVVPYLDKEELTNSIIKLIENPKLREVYMRRGYERILQYSSENVFLKWNELFRDIENS